MRAPKNGIQTPSITLTPSEATQGASGVLAMVMKERATPKPTHVLIRGAYDNPGEEVQRNTPAFSFPWG